MRTRIFRIGTWLNRLVAIGLTSVVLFWGLSGCLPSGQSEADAEAPEANRFTQHVVVDGLDEPMQLDFDSSGRVYWIERAGGVYRAEPETGDAEELGQMSLYEGRSPGLIGLLLDREFDDTGFIYLYYSDAEDEGDKMRLSRYKIIDGAIDDQSEIAMLDVPWCQPDGDHMGGGMVWDVDELLYLSVGDCTAPSEYASIHIDDAGAIQDAARTAGNTNDLRGSILRIDPQPDGSYKIPEGNLFQPGRENTRPEIYVMGSRNPWRLAIDSETEMLHWGDVGPDAGADSDTYGPRGVDEFNVTGEAINSGWPFAYGGRAYTMYDYETGTYQGYHDLDGPTNNSPNNTGLRELPPVARSLVTYPYGVAENWPVLGSGARSAVGGPVFRGADFSDDAPRAFPPYFEGKWLVTDYVRNWIMIITLNDDRTEAEDIRELIPRNDLQHSSPLDMDFGPDGDLYIVEHDRGAQGRISRIQYNDGNRAPVARASARQAAGSLPFAVELSSADSHDPDDDKLAFEWVITPQSTEGPLQSSNAAHPTFTFEEAGRYRAVLTVTDPEGFSAEDEVELIAGNQAPEVNITITEGNRSFYFPDGEIAYELHVDDAEDGSLRDNGIRSEDVSFTAEYIPSGISPQEIVSMYATTDITPHDPLRTVAAQRLMQDQGCQACHAVDQTVVGPSFRDISEQYDDTESDREQLRESITEGSQGRWEDTPMPPNPTLSSLEVRELIDYILFIGSDEMQPRGLPVDGLYLTRAFELQRGDPLGTFFDLPYERGAHILRARYTDRGSQHAAGLGVTSADMKVLRYPILLPETADETSEEGITFTPSTNDPGFFVSGQEAYIGFYDIDLRGIEEVRVGALTRFWHWSHFVGADVELRLGAPDGKMVGEPRRQARPDTLTADDGPFFGDDLDEPATFNVAHLDDQHDLYIVFRNNEASSDDALVVVTGIEFSPLEQ